jgi:ParB family transcriptional regulator, chromosome partitioning protein
MTRPGGLGRGLSALLPAAAPGQSGLITLSLAAIRPNPRQPRSLFEDDSLQELAHSLREVGLIQPIVVRATDEGHYEIVAGERRYRAARMAGLAEIPAIVRHTGDDQLLTEALIENLHRTDLNPVDEAEAYQQLLDDFGFTHDELASRLGRSRSAISNSLRLLALSPAIRERLVNGLLTAGHARALLAIEHPEQRERVAYRIVAEGLSVRATEELIRAVNTQDDWHETLLEESSSKPPNLPGAGRRPHRSPYAGLQRRLEDTLATKVEIRGTPRRGKLIIDYSGSEDLERLLGILGRGTGEDLLHEA